jgi:acyl-CoA reductase-like NAD-dependent aldehyde dehydrogenase
MGDRILIKKTYKMYVGGKFPRSESGQTFMVEDRKGQPVAACCKASRKDFRDAVLAAAAGLKAWKGATGYLKGQILYRAAEMLEGRTAQFVEELQLQGVSKAAARKDVHGAVDRLVYYAGWTDKVGQLFSAVNPVASPHFCFTTPEPTGVIAILMGEKASLTAMTEACCRVLAGGNAGILVSGTELPITASTMGEIWQTSDLPAGALNILTGPVDELAAVVASHRAVDGILGMGLSKDLEKSIQEAGADSLKRLSFAEANPKSGSPYAIRDFLEMKTTWHPVGV